MRFFRALSGLVAGGVTALTAVVVGAAILGRLHDFPGPGTVSVTAHVVATVVVLGAQVLADRRRGLTAFLASMVVFGVTAALLWTQWWN
ncbi:hypothetical protein FOS14_00385 [Skermania sp. ID1734]|uniref:hypothetical protein n=1 Tax=Skermania sp. ID1734 TaxID=2597516 RepID=UPI0011806960|nr:hypothetical protein [Skermania sp. ID1734]TSE01892.1 hypothetical protein FOS14_00385 [Skermania sp. ID1734]